jgi:hypothetical protein
VAVEEEEEELAVEVEAMHAIPVASPAILQRTAVKAAEATEVVVAAGTVAVVAAMAVDTAVATVAVVVGEVTRPATLATKLDTLLVTALRDKSATPVSGNLGKVEDYCD